MIEPWQVWLADLDPTEGQEQAGVRPVVVVSSAFHLRLQIGRMATVAPITGNPQTTHGYRVPIVNDKGDTSWVLTDHMRTISTSRFVRSEPWWNLGVAEVRQVQRILRHMLDLDF